MKKISVFIVFSITIAMAAFAQNPVKPANSINCGRILAKAQNAFEHGRYSEAMTICEQARIARKNEVRWNCYVINNVLNAPEVKRKGPFISDLMPVLKEREEYDAIQIINEQISKKGMDFFANSLPKLYDYLASLKDYPESDFLLAKIYRVEGEYDLSREYLERARSHSNILDVPAQKYDILYEMADLAKVQGNDVEYEKALLLIVEGDGLYKNTTVENAIYKAVKLKRKNVDLAEYFLQFFRAEAINSMTAYFELGDFYEKLGDKKQSFLMTARGVIVGFTRIMEILDDRVGEYSFDDSERHTIAYFFNECKRNEDVLAWTQKNGLWRGIFNMAVRAQKNGWNDFASSFLTKLANSCPDPYWKAAAQEVVSAQTVTNGEAPSTENNQ